MHLLISFYRETAKPRKPQDNNPRMSLYRMFDTPYFLQYIFYPRKDFTPCPDHALDLVVKAPDDVSIVCRFFNGNSLWPTILFFHGNGEVISDYDDIAPLYYKRRLNLIVTDYRGYGKSTGVPTLEAMVHDAHTVYHAILNELRMQGLRDALWIMGRSLGSASAFELAYTYQDSIKGIIIESGFPHIATILNHLGISTKVNSNEPYKETLRRISTIKIPVLIIHGEYDTLVPLEEAQTIYDTIGSNKKELLVIPMANHNDIMYVGLHQYFDRLQKFIEMTDGYV